MNISHNKFPLHNILYYAIIYMYSQVLQFWKMLEQVVNGSQGIWL